MLRERRSVAFATIGDPNVYSTFTYLAQTVGELVPGVVVETVPGITAMQDLAARSGAVLTEGTEPLTLVPVTAGSAVLKEALAGPGTVVAYKFGRRAGEVAEVLRETGRLDDAVWGPRWGCRRSPCGPRRRWTGRRCRICRRSSRRPGVRAGGAASCERDLRAVSGRRPPPAR